jgi:hypothetical protein
MAIQHMRALGVVPVFPVGDVEPGQDAAESVAPASYPETFSVGTWDPGTGRLAADDFHGAATCRRAGDATPARSAPRSLAPGTGVVGAWAGGPHATHVLGGSDVAAAHVAGAAALVLGRFKQLRPDGSWASTLPAEIVEHALEHASPGHLEATRCEDGATACSPGSEVESCAAVSPLARCIGGGTPFAGGATAGLVDVVAALGFEEARTVRWEAPATLGPVNATPRICVAGVAPCTDDPLACSVTLRNLGVVSWEPGVHWLGARGDLGWSSTASVALDVPVRPGEEKRFTIPNCRAPHEPGTHVYRWGLGKVAAPTDPGLTPLDHPTPARAVAVAGKDIADFVSQSPGTFPVPGTSGTINVTFKNAGTTTWKNSRGYRLASGGGTVALPTHAGNPDGDVPPGAAVTFPLSVVLPAAECTPWTTRPFQSLMTHVGVPNAFTTATSPNLEPPAFDRASIESFLAPAPGTVLEPGTPVALGAVIRNCGGTVWAGQHCASLGESGFGGAAVRACASFVPPGGYFLPSGLVGLALAGRHDVGVWMTRLPFTTLDSRTSAIVVPYYWTEAVLATPFFVNQGTGGFFTEVSPDGGATWERMVWSNARGRWEAPWATDFITPAGAMNPRSGHPVAVTFVAPFPGEFQVQSITAADAEPASAADDDGVRVEALLVDPSGNASSVFGLVRNAQSVAWGPVELDDPDQVAFARIVVKPRANLARDLTAVTFRIRGVPW